MNYVIEKGVPLPPKKRGSQSYPFIAMGVGDSFVASRSVFGSVGNFSKRNPGWKFATRTIESKKIRVWCVARPPTEAV